jgi:hypothetical protein
MLRLGICTEQQYRLAVGGGAPPRIAYSLLRSNDGATEEQVRIFEDITLEMTTSNGTNRTSFARRFEDLDSVALEWMQRLFRTDAELRIQDRAASHCLTSWELAQRVFPVFPRASLEASDRVLHLLELSFPSGETYILEPDGQPLQYIRPPIVVSLSGGESRRYPVNRLIARWAAWRFKRMRPPAGPQSGSVGVLPARQLSCIHPLAAGAAVRDARFQIRQRSVFDATVASCHVLRTMNILNAVYFSPEQLAAAADAAFESVCLNGLWIVGRTRVEDSSNHATFFARRQGGWEVLGRFGAGSEIEKFARPYQSSAAVPVGADCGSSRISR